MVLDVVVVLENEVLLLPIDDKDLVEVIRDLSVEVLGAEIVQIGDASQKA